MLRAPSRSGWPHTADRKAYVRRAEVPPEARFAPTDFVRLVYCLGYGENELLDGGLVPGNGGTWQYWDLFGRLTNRGKQPRKPSPLATRLQ